MKNDNLLETIKQNLEELDKNLVDLFKLSAQGEIRRNLLATIIMIEKELEK